MINSEENDPTSLTGAYALDAVSDVEREQLEEYILSSQATRTEVTELKDTAVLLGLATAPVAPSADLKARLMAQIAVTPQHAPIAEPAVEAPIVDSFVATPTPTELKTRERWFSRTAVSVVAAAAAVAVLIGGGFIVANTLDSTSQTPPQASAVEKIQAADDAKQDTADIATGGTATVVWSYELGQAAIIADGMEALTDEQVYELWYINESGPRPAGLFTVDESGTVSKVLDGDMQPGDIIGVTIEPKGGSELPTTDPIVGIQA